MPVLNRGATYGKSQPLDLDRSDCSANTVLRPVPTILFDELAYYSPIFLICTYLSNATNALDQINCFGKGFLLRNQLLTEMGVILCMAWIRKLINVPITIKVNESKKSHQVLSAYRR